MVSEASWPAVSVPGAPVTPHQFAAHVTELNPIDPPPAFCRPRFCVNGWMPPGVPANDTRSPRTLSCGGVLFTLRFTLNDCVLPAQTAGLRHATEITALYG